jgi:hypothetical protein
MAAHRASRGAHPGTLALNDGALVLHPDLYLHARGHGAALSPAPAPMAPVHNARYAKRRRGDEGETAEAPRPPRRTAVLVGVGREIEDAGEVMPALRAHGDVDAIRDLLIGAGGLRRSHVHALNHFSLQMYMASGRRTSPSWSIKTA